MARARFIACALLLLCPLAFSKKEVYDDIEYEDIQLELTANHSEIARNGLRRLWGVADTSAYVGHLFRMEIPKEAFSGEVSAYKVRREDGRRLPGWLAVDSKHGLISGIPQRGDVGSHTFTVTAHGRTRGLTASDTFTIEVKRSEEKPYSKYGTCVDTDKRLVLVILIDGSMQHMSSRQRIRALMQLASFMALDGDEFWIEPYKAESSQTQVVLMSGPGTTQHRRGDATTAIYLNVGCAQKLWPRHKVLVTGIREQSRDGTLAHVLRLPVLGWRLVALQPQPRHKRQSSLEGSGFDNYDDDDDADYSGYDDDGEYNEDYDVKISPFSEPVSEATNVNYTQELLPFSPRILDYDKTVIVPQEIPTTPEIDTQTVIIRETFNLPPSSEAPVMTSPTVRTTVPAPSSVSTTEESSSVSVALPPVIKSTSTTYSTTTEPETTPAVPSTTQEVLTTMQIPTTTSTEKTTVIIGKTTETVTAFETTVPVPVNQPPTLKHHMKKLAITAGKAFRYIIPADLFTDPEEGSNLTFTMYEADNVPLSNTSWIQFIPSGREVYGLPLESHVSRWNFKVEAKDSEGLVARGPLDITVQQHRSRRTINHKFVMVFKLVRDYNNTIDWQIKALEGLVNLFRDTDMDHLTVLNATQNGDVCEFVWTNDTLPRDPACPMDDISRLMKIMESESETGSPSAGLARAMSPELKVSSVSWVGVGQCAVPATKAPNTYPPVTRNQVDHLTATAGHLLVYKVPEDTFFDPEDGGTRNLHLSLRYNDRSELPSGHWLQFDSKNQEFYGLPAPEDIGRVHYQLIAEDSSKKNAYDSLVVEVLRAPAIRPTVEFQMTMEYPFPSLAYDANNKRKVVEKLAALFGQKETDNIRIQSVTDNPTTIIWYNTSLPMDRCPKSEIDELRKMIIVDYRSSAGGALKENVDLVFDKDLKVMSIRLIPQGLCAEQNTKVPKTSIQVHPGYTNQQSKTASSDNGYLVTYIIPAVVTVCMILIAGIIAGVLYRRRLTGKMSVGDEEERQAFRSKGIPVIFQDELEERGDAEPVHKSPVIMREEKPPLLPPAPDYRSTDDAPYRPPPPFAASRTPPRPKATPTYRKPPPYVPP